jgi:predicted glycosyltransferase
MPKRDLYASLPPTEGFSGAHNSTIRIRSALALATIESFDPHLVVVDHAPAGLFRELAPSLAWLRRSDHSHRSTLVMLMRDITFGAEQTRTIWTNEGVYPLLDDFYDRILIYGDRRIYDPIAAYGMSAAAAARTRFCGYLAPQPPQRTPDEVRAQLGASDRPLIAVSVGGGADGAPLLRAYLTGLREWQGPALHSVMVTGPLLPDADLREVSCLATGLPRNHVAAFDPDFAAVVRAADIVVAMGGYNSLTEAVYFGKRPIVAPRVPGAEEQVLRAEGFARLGLATMIPPDELSPATLWQAIAGELARSTPVPDLLPFDGLDRIARELTALATG